MFDARIGATKSLFVLLFATALLWSHCLDRAGGADELDRAELIFQSGGQILSLDSNGEDRKVLGQAFPLGYSMLDIESAPVISPDGLRVAFLEEFTLENGDLTQRLIVSDRESGETGRVLLEAADLQADATIESISWMPNGTIAVVETLELAGRADGWLTRVVSIPVDGTDDEGFSPAGSYPVSLEVTSGPAI